MTALKVLSLTDADVFAGTERLIIELCSSFNREQAVPMIGCPRPSPLAELAERESIEILQVGLDLQAKGSRADWQTIRRLRKALSNGQINIIHVHNGRSALIAALAGAGHKLPMVMSQHFLRPARTSRRGLSGLISRQLHGWLEGRISRHVAISEAVKIASVEGRVAPASKIEVVLNGIRHPAANNSNSTWQTEEWASELNRDLFVFCAARAEPEKDLPTLVRAMQRLCVHMPAAVCAIAGGGSELEQMRFLAQAIEKPNVKLLGFRQDVASLMSKCAVFVLPAMSEPFGLVLLEAMALGKPVIACDAGGPREIIEHGVTGLLVPPGDDKSMADALELLLGDPELRARMGAAGLSRYRTLFTADVMARRMVEVYRDVLAEWGRRRRPLT